MTAEHHRKPSGPLRKLLVTILGALVILLGIILGPLPGPGGIPLILVGLSLLAREYTWAEKIIEAGKDYWKRFVGWLKSLKK